MKPIIGIIAKYGILVVILGVAAVALFSQAISLLAYLLGPAVLKSATATIIISLLATIAAAWALAKVMKFCYEVSVFYEERELEESKRNAEMEHTRIQAAELRVAQERRQEVEKILLQVGNFVNSLRRPAEPKYDMASAGFLGNMKKLPLDPLFGKPEVSSAYEEVRKKLNDPNDQQH